MSKFLREHGEVTMMVMTSSHPMKQQAASHRPSTERLPRAGLSALLMAGLLAVTAAPLQAAPPEPTTPPAQSEPHTGSSMTQPAPEPKAPDTQAADAAQTQGPFYAITRFELRYLRNHPELPEAETLHEIEITLAQSDGRYIAPTDDTSTITVSLDGLASEQPKRYSAQAIQRILETLRDALVQRELMGVYVAPDPADLGPNGRDTRPEGRDTMRLVITVGRVTGLRTVAAGERIDTDQRINHPAHTKIRARSPFQPADSTDAEHGSLLRRDALDEYIYRLSRHPGRRVDTTLSAAEEPAGVTLDYLVTENKPWAVYAQLANTGTAQTDRLRQQFGFFHNQLTGNDDIFSIEYLTATFDETNAVRASYDAPLFDSEYWRWNVHGSWSEFTASDVGFFNDTFTGTTYDYGGEVVANVFQDDNLFIDVFGGARVLDVEVDNTIPGSDPGHEQFFLPHVGVALEKSAEWYSHRDRVELEWQTGDVLSVDEAELADLGRTSPDDQWVVLKWDMAHSVFLEPVLNREAWSDPSTPGTSTLAHEVSARFRGQHAFGSRLIPQLEQVAGGLYTVRGYPESAVAGDTVLIGNFEYRFHIPRVFEIEPTPRDLFGGPFRFAPQYVYGAPDWDLVPRAFVDVGYAISNSNNGSGSVPDETLVGTGIGFDLSYKRNLRLRVDWGWALKSLKNDEFDAGDERLHFAVTVLY